MTIATFDNLKDAISNWMKRSELANAGADDARTTEFIALTEAWLNRKLRTRQMEARSTASFSGEFLALPTDYLSMRDLEFTSDPLRKPPYMTPNQLEQTYPHEGSEEPKGYSIVGDQLQFRPITDTTRTVEIAYYQKIPALSDSNTTNWLLDLAPDVYLFGTRAHADAYFADFEASGSVWFPAFTGAVSDLQASEIRGRYPSGGLAMRSIVSGI
ncbi:MAG TPA: hypothetical protein ENH84_05860 [Phycisphaerae bacterium]|nr:hypothetical protein [Phycisphaerae bacterium]